MATQEQGNLSQLRVQFFDYLFGENSGYLCLAIGNKQTGKFRQQMYEWPKQRHIISNYIESLTSQSDVWFCVNLLRIPERKKENCLPSTFVWADLDDVKPEDIMPAPTCVVQSSEDRYQAYWRIEGSPIPPEIAEDYSRRIAYSVGADKSGWDLTQLLRVPWTSNFKYEPAQPVRLLSILDATYDAATFDEIVVPAPTNGNGAELDLVDKPSEESLATFDQVLYKYKADKKIDDELARLISTTPPENADWSRILWRLIHKCLDVGMSSEEAFVVARVAKCNKYSRDNRLSGHLWRDVVKASQERENYSLLIGGQYETLVMPHLVDFDEFEEDAFIKNYKDWANNATDAPEQYHELTCFIALSAALSAGLYLKVDWGEIIPNLWGLVLGESTLTRKAQPLDSKILTPLGWKLMEDIRLGEEIISHDGTPTKVTGISPQTEKEVFGVTFGDGSYAESCGEHLWTFKGQGSKSEWKTWPLEKIRRAGLRYGSSSQWVRHIPVVKPIEFNFQPHPPIDAYAMGLLLGDGGFSQRSIRFTNHPNDSQLLYSLRAKMDDIGIAVVPVSDDADNIEFRLKERDWTPAGRTKGGHNKLINILRELNLFGKLSQQKFVPDIYKFGSIETRLAVLQGLMDTDGWVDNNGKSSVFCSSSEQLARDVRDIVWSLGGWSSLKVSTERIEKGVTAWNVRVGLNYDMAPFRLKRKLVKLSRTVGRARTMRSIESVGIKVCQCIKVDHPSGLYVTDDFVVTHNTTAMNLAMDIIADLDSNLILASDGSAEGLLTGLSLRPKRVSIFYKDEVSGFFDSINRKDYLAGMPEVLTKLYDVPKIYPRMLRKETITITEPYFIFFGGGIRDKVYSLINESYIESGFLPRFLIVSGENDLSRLRRTGPPTMVSTERKDNIVKELIDLRERYSSLVQTYIAGQQIEVAQRVEAKLTPEAWQWYGDIEELLTKTAADSDIHAIALPTLSRMGFSLLKMSLLVAATRRMPNSNNTLDVELSDVKQAAFYIQKWGKHTIDMLLNAGHSSVEKQINRGMTLIKKKEGITRAEFMQRLHLSAREAKDLIETMAMRGLIEVKQAGRGFRLYTN